MLLALVTLSRRGPKMISQVDAGLGDFDAFGFEEFFLEGGVGLADEDFAALADHAMPGNAFSRGSGGHGTPGAACAAAQAQGFG